MRSLGTLLSATNKTPTSPVRSSNGLTISQVECENPLNNTPLSSVSHVVGSTLAAGA